MLADLSAEMSDSQTNFAARPSSRMLCGRRGSIARECTKDKAVGTGRALYRERETKQSRHAKSEENDDESIRSSIIDDEHLNGSCAGFAGFAGGLGSSLRLRQRVLLSPLPSCLVVSFAILQEALGDLQDVRGEVRRVGRGEVSRSEVRRVEDGSAELPCGRDQRTQSAEVRTSGMRGSSESMNGVSADQGKRRGLVTHEDWDRREGRKPRAGP